MVETEIILGAFKTFLDGPAQSGDAGQFGKRRSRRSKNEIIGALGRFSAAASNQEPMRKARVFPPMQPHARPIVKARSFGAFASGVASESALLQGLDESLRCRSLKRAAAAAQKMIGAHCKNVRLLALFKHMPQAAVGAVDGVAKHEGAGDADVEIEITPSSQRSLGRVKEVDER